MKPATTEKLYKVRQIIRTNSMKAANKLLESPDWILINTYKRQGGTFFYVLGRISEEN